MSYKFSVKFGIMQAVAFVAAVFIAASPASAQTSEPASGGSLNEQIAAATGIYLDMARKDSGKFGEVTDAMLSLDMAYYQALLNNAQNEDPEVSARILSIIRNDIIDTRIRRVMAILPKEDGEKLRAFQDWKPQLFRDFFSSELSDRIRAAKLVGNMKDPQCLAEPLLVLCIKHPSKELVSAAIESASKGNYKSETLVSALIDIIETHGMSTSNSYYYDETEDLPPGLMAMETLQSIATPYASARLFNLIFTGNRNDPDDQIPLAEVLAATGDKRLIPLLINELKNNRTRSSRGIGELNASCAVSDVALLVLLRLTGQNIADYKIVYFKQYNYCLFGFSDDADRKQAIKKFQDWWEENKSQPAYRDIAPLNLKEDNNQPSLEDEQPPKKISRKDIAVLQTQPDAQPDAEQAVQPDTQPATPPETQPAAQPETQPEVTVPDLESLKAGITAETQRLIKVFHDANFRTRENAQADLLAIRATKDMALSANINNDCDDIRKLVVNIMANSMAEARITQTLIELDEADRDKLMEFRNKHSDIFRDIMSLTWSQNIRAVKKIGDLKLTQAEPLLLMSLKHSYEPVVIASIMAAGRAGCKSDAMVDALCKIVTDALPANTNRGFSMYQFIDDGSASGAALDVLKKLKSPRCLPHMLNCMDNKFVRYNAQALFVFADIIASVEDINAIPELMKYLDNPRGLGSWSSGNESITMSTADPALLALIKLTKQREKTYNLIRWKESYERIRIYGFKTDEDRTKAIAQFKEWWAKNKNEAPYKDIQPITPAE